MNRQTHFASKMTDRARHRRHQQSYHEYTLWQMIHRFKLGVPFQRQRPIGRFIVDFYSASVKLAIELDGPWHETDEGIKHDAEETATLAEYGIKLLRFPIARMSPSQICEQIAAWLADKRAEVEKDGSHEPKQPTAATRPATRTASERTERNRQRIVDAISGSAGGPTEPEPGEFQG
jgi:very-short-patch-repair endonuclease